MSQFQEWTDFLVTQGAHFDQELISDFGQPKKELEASASGKSVLADLSHLGLIEVKGEDACQFLQGQLTCDVNSINSQVSTLGCYVNLKGRAHATFRLICLATKPNEVSRYWLVMNRELVPQVMEKLQKYILFSNAEMNDLSKQWGIIGLSGPKATQQIQTIFSKLPVKTNAVIQDGNIPNGIVVNVGTDQSPRFEIYCGLSSAINLWTHWNTEATAIGNNGWLLQNIRLGMAAITSRTTEMCMPAELTFDRNGGVSFTKGCYAGQEVIARLHYKGTLKQDLYHLQLSGNELPSPGTKISRSNASESSEGFVVNAAFSAEKQMECLAILKIDSADKYQLTIGENPITKQTRVSMPPTTVAKPMQ